MNSQFTRENFEEIVNHNPDGILVIDQNARIIFSNPAAGKLFETPSDNLLGQEFGFPVAAGIPAEISIITFQSHTREMEMHVSSLTWEGEAVHMVTLRDISERKAAQNAVLESKQTLQTILDTLPVKVFWKDLDLNFLGCNKAFAKLSGWNDPKLLIGKDDFDMSWKDNAESYRKDDKEVINTSRNKLQFEEKLPRPDGSFNWIRTSKVPLKKLGGRISGMVGVFEDITKIKRATEHLKESEAKYRSIFEGESDALILVEKKSKQIRDVNRAAISLFGFSREELMGMQITDLSAEPEKTVESINAIKPGHFHKVDIRQYRRKDGTLFPVEISVSCFELQGEIIAFEALRDISERLAAEEQLETLGLAIEQSLTSVIITDPQGAIEYVNPFFSKLTGYSLEECLEKNPSFLSSGAHSKSFYKNLWDTILGGETWRGEFYNKKKNGQFYWESAIISPVWTGGEIKHFVGIKLDITQKKEAENMFKIMQEQVLAAHKLAAIGQLSAGVSHEVLNPVNIISMHMQILQRKRKDDGDLQQIIEKVRDEIGRIQKIVSSLLTFSRKGNSEKGPVITGKLIDEIMNLVEADLILDNIKVERKWCMDDLVVTGDKDKLRQVFLNLINNAKDAMPDGGVLTVGCQPLQIDNVGWAQVIVGDTGTGISKNDLEKLFLPFFTTKPEGEGTGMGLALVHGIVEDHKGLIRVETEEGQGTNFIVELPLAPGKEGRGSGA